MRDHFFFIVIVTADQVCRCMYLALAPATFIR